MTETYTGGCACGAIRYSCTGITAESGVALRRAFCLDCGSPVFIANGARPDNRVLYAGSLDDPSRYQPSRNIYGDSAQPWAEMHPDLPKDAGMPGR